MPSRGKYLHRKFSSRSIRRKRSLRRIESLTYYAGAVLLLVAIILAAYRVFSGSSKKINIPIENVSAFKIPHRDFKSLKEQSGKYGVSFAQAVSLYSIENNFFPDKTGVRSDTEQFMREYSKIRDSYRAKDVEPYYEMMNALLGEIKYFPIPTGYGDDSGYMYGDSWNAKTNRGVDVLDRENVRGRIPVVSMTAGTVKELGWKDRTGYQIVIMTTQNTHYFYSRLDSFAEGLSAGSVIEPGALLGYMGADGSAPVRLHLSISPQFSPEPKDFYINPYPFLRLIEDSRFEYGL